MLSPDSRVVVVGAGLGGATVVEQLRREGHAGPLALVGREPEHPYDRPPLSKAALRDGDGPAHLRPLEEYAGVDLRLGHAVTTLDPVRREVGLDDATRLPYDALVLAPGADPVRLPVLDGLAGVHVLRTHEDALGLRADTLREHALVVVGGGVLGSEVASSARALGAEVDLVELLDGPLVRVLGPAVAARVAGLHRASGVRLRTGVGVDGARAEDGRVRAVELSDGTVLTAPVVLVAVGVRPATGWLAGSGVDLGTDGAVVCDRVGRTSVERVWALGDAAAWRGADGALTRVEHWTSAVEQAGCVAAALLAGGAGPPSPVPYFWSEQAGVLLQVVGEVTPQTEAEVHPVGSGLLALHARDDALLGVVAVDAKRLAGRARRLLRDRPPLEAARAALLR